MVKAVPVRAYARIAGVLLLLSLLAGGFGEAYVPSKLIVSSDPAATARNILASGPLFRWGFASYLVEALCDVGLAWVFYVLLRPVDRDLALFAVFFRLISTAGFAMGEVLVYSSPLVLGGPRYLAIFSPDQRDALALLLVKVGARGGDLFSMFYGVGSIAFGLLMFRSGFLPWILGVLLAVGGAGFVVGYFVKVLAPAYASNYFLAPVFLAFFALMPWLLVKGVDVSRWEEAAARAEGHAP